MADMHDAQHWAERDIKSFFTRITNLTGAMLSLALIAGIGMWGYKTIMRDVSGVPVVRAAKEPMRVAPDDPGGRAAAHQGLAVNAIAAEGTAAPPPDRLVLAPPPLELSVEDIAEAPTTEPAAAPGAVPSAAPAPEPDAHEADTATESLQQVSMLALAEQITAQAAALTVSQPEDAGPDAPPETAGAARDGLERSLRPRPRPVRLTSISDVVAASVAASVAAASTPIDVAPDAVAPGTRLAQLGAFDSAEVARSEWTAIAARFGDFIDGKQRVIQRAESGGRIFYRLRAMGFDDLGDARRFCSALVAEGADCIPVIAR